MQEVDSQGSEDLQFMTLLTEKRPEKVMTVEVVKELIGRLTAIRKKEDREEPY